MSIESADPMQSPDHKKHKSTSKSSKKRVVLKESIRRRLDELNESQNATGETESQESVDSLEQINDEMEELMESNPSSNIPPTSERQYTASQDKEVNSQASSSDGRGSSS